MAPKFKVVSGKPAPEELVALALLLSSESQQAAANGKSGAAGAGRTRPDEHFIGLSHTPAIPHVTFS